MWERNEAMFITDDLESDVSAEQQPTESVRSGWLRMGTVAIASALIGGVAAAWYYRKTLARFQDAEEHTDDVQPAEDET